MSEKEGKGLFSKHQDKLGDGLTNPAPARRVEPPPQTTRSIGQEPPFKASFRSPTATSDTQEEPSLPIVLFDSLISPAEAITDPVHPVIAVPDLIIQSPSCTWLPAVMLKGALKGSMRQELQEVYSNPNTRRGLGLLTWGIIVSDALWREEVVQTIAPYIQQITTFIEQTFS